MAGRNHLPPPEVPLPRVPLPHPLIYSTTTAYTTLCSCPTPTACVTHQPSSMTVSPSSSARSSLVSLTINGSQALTSR
uniref:Uncharacterized protein n=1 Tax=Rhizophora mucronata TaxID=61149 RepID=A0A2P2Q9N0_RHIMU